MPASEETYRRLPGLHIAFAVTSVAMTAVIVWMIMADHTRPWKEYQREFQQIETAKLKAQQRQAAADQRAKSKAQLDELRRRRERAEQKARTNAREINSLQALIDSTRGKFQKLDTRRRFKKAELDSLRSFYDGMIDRDERREAARFLAESIVPAERDLLVVSREYDEVSRELTLLELRKSLSSAEYVEVADAPPPGTQAAAAGFQAGDEMASAQFETLRPAVEEVLGGGGAKPARTVDVQVSRAGREVTLSVKLEPIQSPDRPESPDEAWLAFGLRVTPLTAEVLTSRVEDLTREADRLARTLEQKEQQYGEGGLWNRVNAWARGLPLLDMAAPPVKIQQITLPELTINYNFKEVPRFDRCTTCHQGIDRVGYDKDAKGKEMPLVYHAHPHLTDGTTYIDPKGKEMPAGLYLDSNGPHPINSFGCTICHGGQGSGTTFTFASHEPNDLHQKKEWEERLDWHEMHHWDFPMVPDRFMESSCLKCHHQVTDLEDYQAPKLMAGYNRITRFGCTGCHTIGGEDVFGPDLTDNRKTGPNLQHVASKVSPEWMLKWIANPHAFRPDSRMPRFYGVTNNDHPDDLPKSNAEIHAITHYLMKASSAPKGFVDPPAEGDAARGKQAFLEKGCLACHSNRAYAQSDLPKSLNATISAAYAIDPDKSFGPDAFPEPVRNYARAEFGPNLSSMAAKFSSRDQGYKWLANWIRSPEQYHPKSLMPNLQLSAQEAADIASWILSAREDWGPGSDEKFWPVKVEVPAVDSEEVKKGLDELMKLYLSKSKVYNQRTILLSEVDSVIESMSTEDKLSYVGQRTISRLGCYGCHEVPGFEGAKPIGTPLDGWGYKPPARLDFAHIGEYLASRPLGEEGERDGTPEYYQEKLADHNRTGFLYQKLHRPRSYDYKKDRENILAWDERLRMPQFSWADDPAAIEEVMTFVLGLTGERIPSQYMPNYDAPKLAKAKGARLLERYNCRGCHTLAMPKYTIASDANLNRVFKSTDASDPDPFQTNVNLAYDNRGKDYLALLPDPRLKYDPAKRPELGERQAAPITIEGMPTFLDVQEDDQGKPIKTLYVQLWQPVTIRGFTFNVGDTMILDPDQVTQTPAEGGDFAWLYSAYEAEKTGEPMPPVWNKLPPPLIREGSKVQTPWLTGFLQDPYKIRPAAMLRMPKFHYGVTREELAEQRTGGPAGIEQGGARESTLGETRDLANYFAARDKAVFPYQEVPQHEQAYLADREKIFAAEGDASSESAPKAGASPAPKYLEAGWSITTKNQCVQCHPIGQYQPTGEPKSHGPNLRQVPGRLRPEYMLQWIAQPSRVIPYTAMPQVFPPTMPEGSPPLPGIPKELEGKPLEQVRTVRDTLLNYVTALEQQLARVAPAEPPPPPAQPAAEAGQGGGQAQPAANAGQR